jgi:hypothetical protein
MASKPSDTDPSTPSARAAQTQPIAPSKIVAVAPGPLTTTQRLVPSTDPGVAPPRARVNDTVPDPPRGSSTDPGVAPPANPPRGSTTDSIDTLLEGISGEQPEKTKRQPQSRGAAAASYQAEHSVLPGRPTDPSLDSVIVERPKQAPTMKIDRARIDAARAEHEARTRTKALEASTVVTPKPQGPRVVIALFAAILVVTAFFLVMRMWAAGVKADAVATDPTAGDLIKTFSKTGPVLASASAASAAPSASAAQATSATATVTATVTAPTTTATAATTAATQPAAPATTTATATTATTAPPRGAVPDLKTDFKP